MAAVTRPMPSAAAMAGGSPMGVVQGIVGWAAAYPELDVLDVLTSEASRNSQSIESSCAGAAAFADLSTEDVFATNPLEVPSWRKRIDASEVRQAHVPSFFVVAPTSPSHVEDMRSVAERLCKVSTTVEFRTYPGADHDSVLQIAEGDYLAWIADRFAGRPATGNCDA